MTFVACCVLFLVFRVVLRSVFVVCCMGLLVDCNVFVVACCLNGFSLLLLLLLLFVVRCALFVVRCL